MKELMTAGRATLMNGRNIPFTRLTPLADIKLHEKFQDLFPLNQLTIDKIAGRMRESGYDASQPLHIWETEGQLILIDGHHRRMAARAVGITEVPCYIHRDFADIDDAELYAISLQTERRNLSDKELADMIPKVDALKKRGLGSSGVKGKSAEQTAEVLHTSRNQVEKHRFVRKYGGEELVRRMRNDEITLNQAYNLVKEQRSGGDSEEKKPARRDAQRIFLEKAAKLLNDAGYARSVEVLIGAFLPEEEREAFRTALLSGGQG